MNNNSIPNVSSFPITDNVNDNTLTSTAAQVQITFGDTSYIIFNEASSLPSILFSVQTATDNGFLIQTDSTLGFLFKGASINFVHGTGNIDYLTFSWNPTGSVATIASISNVLIISAPIIGIDSSSDYINIDASSNVELNAGSNVTINCNGGTGGVQFSYPAGVGAGAFTANGQVFGGIVKSAGAPSVNPPDVNAVWFNYDTTNKKIYAWNPTLGTPAWETPAIL